MQEQVLKLSIVVLAALLAGLVALGAFLVAGTQGGSTAEAIEAISPEPPASVYAPDPLPVEDHALS